VLDRDRERYLPLIHASRKSATALVLSEVEQPPQPPSEGGVVVSPPNIGHVQVYWPVDGSPQQVPSTCPIGPGHPGYGFGPQNAVHVLPSPLKYIAHAQE
jgi:hypothetical protein